MLKSGRKYVATGLVLIIIVIAGIFVYYFVRSSFLFSPDDGRTSIDIERDRPDMVLEPFEYNTFDKEGRKVMSIRAAKLKGFLRAGVYAVSGIEEAIFLEKDGSQAVVHAREGVIEEQTKNVSLSGDVRIIIRPADPQEQPFYFFADDLRYTDQTSLFETAGPVKAHRGDMRFGGTGMQLDRQSKTMLLEDAVTTEFSWVREPGAVGVPISVSATSARYDHEAGFLHYWGGVTVVSPPHRISAVDMKVFLGEPEKRIDFSEQVRGEFVRIDVSGEGDKAPPSGVPVHTVQLSADNLSMYQATGILRCTGSVAVRDGDRTLNAEELELITSEDGGKVSAISAVGDVRLLDGDYTAIAEKAFYSVLSDRMVMSGKPEVTTATDRIQGDQIIVFPEQKQYYINGHMKGRFQPRSEKTDGKDPRAVSQPNAKPAEEGPVNFSASRGHFDRMTGTIVLEGEAIISRNEGVVHADLLTITIGNNNEVSSFEAVGNVRGIQETYNATCDRMSYDATLAQANLTGRCRLWQGASSIRAPRMVIYTSRNMVQALDGVSVHLEGDATAAAPAGLQDLRRPFFGGAPTDITADTLLYQKDISRAIFDGNVRVVRTGRPDEAGKLTSDHLQIDMAGDNTQKVKQVEATGSVRMTQQVPGGQRTVEGDSAVYDGDSDVLTISGKNVKINDPQNSITCAVAHFHLSDNHYVIEGPQTTTVYYPDGRVETGKPAEKPLPGESGPQFQTPPGGSSSPKGGTGPQQKLR